MAFKLKSKTAKKVIDIGNLVAEYAELRERKGIIEDRLKQLADIIKDYSYKNGEKDSKGSYYCSNDDFTFGALARPKITIDTDGLIEYLKKAGYSEAYKKEINYVINEEVLNNLVKNGEIEEETLKGFATTEMRYAISLTKKEEMPEIEQSALRR